MPKASAGLLLYRGAAADLEVLLGHPGGPFWAKRDAGAWSILKGGIEPGESAADAARREFQEETGHPPPATRLRPLGDVRQAGGKVVTAFGVAGDFRPELLSGQQIELEWPPRSGRLHRFPEIDRVAWFAIPDARVAILSAQEPFLDRLLKLLHA